MRREMAWSMNGSGHKDILVVVKDQYRYVRNCLESVFANTSDFTLQVWDNASDEPTRNYLLELSQKPNVRLWRSDTNEGFIVPNNRMAEKTSSEWIILLNSDTEVLPRWDEVLVGTMRNNPEMLQVGFRGGILGNLCELEDVGSGRDIDYVFGYCFCIRKQWVDKTGLFDEKNLCFAYCEDSDLSLRIREAGGEIYACYSDGLVRHYGSKTTSSVIDEDPRLLSCARSNLRHLKSRWSSFIRLYGKGKERYNVPGELPQGGESQWPEQDP